MRIFLFILLLFTSVNAIFQNDRVRIWKRIPPFFVYDRVSNFLNENRITNCFEFRETETNLLLKCWRDNKLADVSIDINPGRREQKSFFGMSVSV